MVLNLGHFENNTIINREIELCYINCLHFTKEPVYHIHIYMHLRCDTRRVWHKPSRKVRTIIYDRSNSYVILAASIFDRIISKYIIWKRSSWCISTRPRIIFTFSYHPPLFLYQFHLFLASHSRWQRSSIPIFLNVWAFAFYDLFYLLSMRRETLCERNSGLLWFYVSYYE